MASQSTLLVLALHNERWLQEKCKHKKLCFCLRCILVEVTALTIFGAFWGFAEIHQSLDIVFRHLIINLQCILQVIFQIIYFQFEKSYLQWLLVDEVFGRINFFSVVIVDFLLLQCGVYECKYTIVAEGGVSHAIRMPLGRTAQKCCVNL